MVVSCSLYSDIWRTEAWAGFRPSLCLRCVGCMLSPVGKVLGKSVCRLGRCLLASATSSIPRTLFHSTTTFGSSLLQLPNDVTQRDPCPPRHSDSPASSAGRDYCGSHGGGWMMMIMTVQPSRGTECCRALSFSDIKMSMMTKIWMKKNNQKMKEKSVGGGEVNGLIPVVM